MNTVADFAVLLPAAGSGSRFGGGDKLLTDLAGQSVLQRSVGLFAGRPDVAAIVIITAPERFDAYREHLRLPAGMPLRFVAGGRERWESVLFGLRALGEAGGGGGVPLVAIHDAARPLTPAGVIDAAFSAARVGGASIPGVPEPATLKRRSAEGMIAATVDRRELFQAQTPQCFALATLLAAYEALLAANGAADITDDAQVCERAGVAVRITAGSPVNLKVTTPEDVILARAILGQK